MYNVFEDVGGREFNTVKEIKNTFLEEGALGTVMTGSGSAVFGVFDKEKSAASAVEKLKNTYPFSALAVPVNN
jgi:4-diphosphocytidyl-2-C-methyl-D-erythritol kinase